MKFRKLAFWMILPCILTFALCVACGDDDDDDDDDNENPSVDDDDDDASCDENDLCEFALTCGIGDYASMDECLADQGQGEDYCDDYDAIISCSCDCLEKYPNDCTQAAACGETCWENC